MTLILESHPNSIKKQKSNTLIVIGNGPAFLQSILMLAGRDVLPVTNNDADFLTLERLGAYPIKKDFQSSSLSFVGEHAFKIILISSSTHARQIIRALHNCITNTQVMIIVRYPKMRKISKHPYTYIIDTFEQFDKDLWHRCMILYRLCRIHEFLKSKRVQNQKVLKMLIVFFGSPDPDAIASSVAFSRLFSKLVSPSYVSTAKVKRFENRVLLSYMKIRVRDISEVNYDDFDLIVCLDAQPAFFTQSNYHIPFDICIDHHPEQEDSSGVSILDVRKNYGACSTILAQYYYYSKLLLPKTLATALLFGIKTDTVNFTRSVCEPDVNMMTFLYKKVDHDILKKFDFSKIPKRTLKYFKRAYNRYIFDGTFLLCHIGRVGYLDIGSIIAEHFLKIQKVYFSVVSCIYREKVFVFFRSVSKSYHAGEFASKIFAGFGVGGGHADMGRAECLTSKLPFAQKDFEKELYDFLKKEVKSANEKIRLHDAL